MARRKRTPNPPVTPRMLGQSAAVAAAALGDDLSWLRPEAILASPEKAELLAHAQELARQEGRCVRCTFPLEHCRCVPLQPPPPKRRRTSPPISGQEGLL